MDLQDASVLITGGSRGIGRELAISFAAAGAKPVVVARDKTALAAVAALTGGVALEADLDDPLDVAGLWRRAEDAVGPVSVLVNNAGIVEPGNFADSDSATLERTVQVNVLSPMVLCRDAIRSMQPRRRGHLVNVSSLAGVATVPGLAAYSASKAALNQLTRVLAVELSDQPIGTTLVELGPVPTDLLQQAKAHHPTERSFRRMYRLGLLVDVPASTVAAAVVQAVRADKPHVRLPRRAAGLAALAEAPRTASRAILVRVPRRT
jgi:NAD(P)-dependent dehydrogenase (short-subunit alcohol dehydrogenase family)